MVRTEPIMYTIVESCERLGNLGGRLDGNSL